MSVSESVSVSASVSVSVAPFTLNENSCQFSTLSYVPNCLARRQSVILYRDLQDSDGNGRPYQFFTVGGPIDTERTLIWWHWIGDWHGNWCSLNTASNLIRKWLLFGHGDWYGHGDGHGDGHSVNVPWKTDTDVRFHPNLASPYTKSHFDVWRGSCGHKIKSKTDRNSHSV